MLGCIKFTLATISTTCGEEVSCENTWEIFAGRDEAWWLSSGSSTPEIHLGEKILQVVKLKG